MLMKVLGLIWRPSFSSYRFSLNWSLWDLPQGKDSVLIKNKLELLINSNNLFITTLLPETSNANVEMNQDINLKFLCHTKDLEEVLSHCERQIHTNIHSHCLDISGQSSQPNVKPLSHREDLLEICGDHLSLNAESPVCCYRHTVLPSHGHDGPSIIRHNRLEQHRKERELSVRAEIINISIDLSVCRTFVCDSFDGWIVSNLERKGAKKGGVGNGSKTLISAFFLNFFSILYWKFSWLTEKISALY